MRSGDAGLGSGLSSWTLSQAVPGAGDLWDNIADFLEFHFTNLRRNINN